MIFGFWAWAVAFTAGKCPTVGTTISRLDQDSAERYANDYYKFQLQSTGGIRRQED